VVLTGFQKNIPVSFLLCFQPSWGNGRIDQKYSSKSLYIQNIFLSRDDNGFQQFSAKDILEFELQVQENSASFYDGIFNLTMKF
jgi:hypothetical protein